MALKNRFIQTAFNGNKEAFAKAKADNYRKVKTMWYEFVANLCDDGRLSASEMQNIDILLASAMV